MADLNSARISFRIGNGVRAAETPSTGFRLERGSLNEAVSFTRIDVPGSSQSLTE